jgi:hypothetical protein
MVTPHYQDPHFSLGSSEDRIVRRFHVEGVPVGRRVCVVKIDPYTGEWLRLLTTGIVGVGGWVDLTEPILVLVVDAFIAVPEG